MAIRTVRLDADEARADADGAGRGRRDRAGARLLGGGAGGARAPRQEPLRPPWLTRREWGAAARGLQLPRHRPRRQARRRHGIRVADLPRRRRDLPRPRRRVDPRVEFGGPNGRRRAGADRRQPRRGRRERGSLRRRRQHRRRLQDLVGNEHQLRGRRHAVGNVAVVRGARGGTRVGVRPPGEARCGRPPGPGDLSARGRVRGPAPRPRLSDGGPLGRRLLPVHPAAQG
jgi:hypothetical protein